MYDFNLNSDGSMMLVKKGEKRVWRQISHWEEDDRTHMRKPYPVLQSTERLMELLSGGIPIIVDVGGSHRSATDARIEMYGIP